VRIGKGGVNVKPSFATGGARLAVSCVDRWHAPTLILTLSDVDDVLFIWRMYDAYVIDLVK
jgi:hypothetical protein